MRCCFWLHNKPFLKCFYITFRLHILFSAKWADDTRDMRKQRHVDLRPRKRKQRVIWRELSQKIKINFYVYAL